MHHLRAESFAQGAVEHTHIGDYTTIGIEFCVEDQGAQGRRRVARGWRHLADHGFQDLLRTDPLARTGEDHGLRRQPDHLFDLFSNQLGIRLWQVDLVDDGHDFEMVLERLVHVS